MSRPAEHNVAPVSNRCDMGAPPRRAARGGGRMPDAWSVRLPSLLRKGWGTHAMLAVGALVLAACGGMVRAQESGSVDDLERRFDFIDRAERATALFNENRPAEALAIFQQLAAAYPDLDDDGQVAVSIADCLAALERVDEAWAAYEAARSVHPELGDSVGDRLIELELDTDVSDALIDTLRREAFAETPQGRTASWRLGRALQRRAAGLVNEAIQAFQFAAEADVPFVGHKFVQDYAGTLEGIADDLAALIEQMDRRASGLRAIGQVGSFPCGRVEIADQLMTVERSDVQWSGQTEQGQRFGYRIQLDDPGGEVQITVNGRPIELGAAQRRLIDHYQQRIGTILHEAVQSTDGSPAEP